MANNIIEVDRMEHNVCELMCIKCYYRYIGVYPAATPLKELQCPNCGYTGGIFKTGQDLGTAHVEWKE